MADTKITDLAALTGANSASTDVFVLVDVSDNTMAASGTDKKMTRDELRLAMGVAPTQQVLTVGSGTYSTPAGCVAILVEMVGGGGGGAGGGQTTSNASPGSGGGSGAWLRKLIATPAATYAYTTGAKGAGGTAGANNGTAGSNSTFGSGGGLLTATGGGAGNALAAGTSAATIRGGIPAAVATGGDVNTTGTPGGYSVRLSGTVANAGVGGPSFYGGGGRGRNDESVGEAGGAYGAGGGGANCLGTTARAGGDGADGIIVVTEFY